PSRAAARPAAGGRCGWIPAATRKPGPRAGAAGSLVAHGRPAGRGAGDLAEDRARHQAGAARIVEVEEAADQFSRRVEAGNALLGSVENRRFGIDAKAAEREGDAAGGLIGLERGLVDAMRPVRLVDLQAFRAAAILDVGVVGDVGPDGCVVA